jgi:AcrR family transcriptional regulator
MPYRRTEKVVLRLAARHDAIVAAARALASEGGMDAVQIAPVAERAGIAAGTVYRYFPSKAELVAALVAALSEQEIGAAKRAADAAPGPLSALTASIATFAARARAHRRLAFALMAEPVDAEADAARIGFRKTLVAEIESRVRTAIGGGHLPEQDAHLAAASAVGALTEGLIGPLAPETSDAAKTRETVQAATLLVLRALGVVDARARGLIMQCALPSTEADAA